MTLRHSLFRLNIELSIVQPHQQLHTMSSNRDSAIPPSYAASSRDPQIAGSPPAYTFPEVFKIGNKQTTGPLVTSSQLHAHLGLLQHFWDLRQAVENGKDARIPASAQALEPELRWAWFVALAVDRFERWVKAIRYNFAVDDSLPPLDVVMVWHAYLLNPGCVDFIPRSCDHC